MRGKNRIGKLYKGKGMRKRGGGNEGGKCGNNRLERWG